MAQTYKLNIEIPELPKTINEIMYKHWSVKMLHAKKWKGLVFLATLGKRPTTPLTKAHLILTRCSAKEPDFDGLVSSFKACIDGLVDAKIIENDKTENIGQPEYVWEKAKPKQGLIRIEVKSCE